MTDTNNSNSGSYQNRKPAGKDSRPGRDSRSNRSGYGFNKSSSEDRFSRDSRFSSAGSPARPALRNRKDSERSSQNRRKPNEGIRVYRSEQTEIPSSSSRSSRSGYGFKPRRDSDFSKNRNRTPSRRNEERAPRQVQRNPKLKVQRWGINGEGIAYKNHKPVFVEGVIPDETAIIEITEENDRYAKGRLVELIDESPRRRHPVCPIADQCGGCALMHVDYKGQIRAKENLLKEALKKYAHWKGEIQPMVKNPSPLAYRNACKFPFGFNEEGQISTGMYERNSNDFVPVPRCLIHSKKLEKIRHEVEDVLRKYDLKPYDRETKSGLRNLVLKEFDDQVHIILVTSEMDLPEEMVNDLLSLENAASVWQSIKDDTDMEFEMFGSRMIHLGGEMKMTLTLGDLSLELLPRSFFQLNTAQAKQLYDQVVSWIPEDTGLLVEAYSGIGAMSLSAADKANEVIGIEVVEDAVANARDNALANGKENVSFICGDAGEELEKIAANQNVDVLLVDPPRSGLNKKMKESVHEAKPKKIIYVSCNPATLGKDIADLSDLYEIEEVVPFDMFSQTPQVETAVLLSRNDL